MIQEFQAILNAMDELEQQIDSPKDPMTLREALEHPAYGGLWAKAKDEEVSAFIRNKVWEFTPRPKNRKTIKTKYVFKYKLNPDGSVSRCKTRIVTKGYTQVEGIDYHETFASVAKMDSIRLIFAYAIMYDLEIEQMDVVNAFLLADIDEEIYAEIPEGVELPPHLAGEDRSKYVIRILKSMYGLKQAGRNWYEKLHTTLLALGFERLESDHAVYIHPSSKTIIAFWVDDIMILNNSKETINSLKKLLTEQFEMKDLGPMTFFLGLAIIRTHNKMYISQQHYIKRILDAFQQDTGEQLYPTDVPIKPSSNLIPHTGNPHNKPLYQKYLGCVSFVKEATRPDIAYAVQRLSRFASNPSKEHWDALVYLLRYLLRTERHALLYQKATETEYKRSPIVMYARQLHETEKARENRLSNIIGFTDADFAAGWDRKSISGNLFFYQANCISWSSKKINLVATSTLEAEYAALSIAGRQAIWFRMLDGELRMLPEDQLETVQTFCDNESAIKVVKNPEAHAKTKHFDIHMHFVRQRVALQHIKVDYLPTKQMPADFLTKALPKKQFEACRDACNVVPVPHELLKN